MNTSKLQRIRIQLTPHDSLRLSWSKCLCVWVCVCVCVCAQRRRACARVRTTLALRCLAVHEPVTGEPSLLMRPVGRANNNNNCVRAAPRRAQARTRKKKSAKPPRSLPPPMPQATDRPRRQARREPPCDRRDRRLCARGARSAFNRPHTHTQKKRTLPRTFKHAVELLDQIAARRHCAAVYSYCVHRGGCCRRVRAQSGAVGSRDWRVVRRVVTEENPRTRRRNTTTARARSESAAASDRPRTRRCRAARRRRIKRQQEAQRAPRTDAPISQTTTQQTRKKNHSKH